VYQNAGIIITLQARQYKLVFEVFVVWHRFLIGYREKMLPWWVFEL